MKNDGARGLLSWHNNDPQRDLADVGHRRKDCLTLDTSATYSVLNTRSGRLSHKRYTITGVSGKAFIEPLAYKFDEYMLTHSFPYVPEHPYIPARKS